MTNSCWFGLLLTLIVVVGANNPCNQRKYDSGNVCVCNSSYCDDIPTLLSLTSGQYQLYSTSKANLGFSSTTGTFSNTSKSADETVTIANLTKTHQTIVGFGGAFTDATGINILRLSEAAQSLLLESYFGETGVQYSFGRIPIGGTDFSTKGYTYCDEQDETLGNFTLQEEDYNYKIPFVQKAIELRGQNNIKFFASAWSAPIWMKTNDEFAGFGKIQDKYYGLWAQYYLKFFDAYKDNNITFWGVTTQNEPVDGLIGTIIPNNGFTSSDMKRWVKDFIGPVIRNSSYSDLKIMLHDDQRALLPDLKLFVLSDNDVVKYADGVALHWYSDAFTPKEVLSLASSDEKELFRLATEACSGSLSITGLEKSVDLGSWNRAESYLNSIMDDLEYDFVGWVDWNMVLNETGGPTWLKNEVDSPIIVNGTSDEFYKQPMFYALGHFSKFIVTDSVRVDTATSGCLFCKVSSLAFVRPDKKIAVILKNSSDNTKKVTVNILDSTETFTLAAHSINTLLYAPQGK